MTEKSITDICTAVVALGGIAVVAWMWHVITKENK